MNEAGAQRVKSRPGKGVASTAVVGIGISVLSVAIQLGIVILLGERIGVAGIGAYLGWFSAFQIASTVARFGCGQLVVRLLAEPDDRSQAVRAVRSFTTAAGVVLGTLGFFVVLAVSGFSVALSVGVGIVSLTHLSMSSAIARGSGHVVAAQGVLSLLPAAVMLLSVIAFRPDSADIAVALQSASFLAAAIATLGVMSYLKVSTAGLSVSGMRGFRSDHDERLAQEASRLFTNELTSMATTWLPGLLLPVFATNEIAGLFGGANRVARPLLLIQTGVNNTIGPRIAGSKTDVAVAKRFSRQGSLLTTALATPLVLVLIVGAATFLSILGDGFEEGASTLIVLAGATYLGLATGPVNMLLSLRGHASDSARGALLGLLVLVCGLLLSSTAVHAAFAVAANTIVRSAYGAVMVRRRFGFWVFPQYRSQPT